MDSIHLLIFRVHEIIQHLVEYVHLIHVLTLQ